jgi:hypothetical protein
VMAVGHGRLRFSLCCRRKEMAVDGCRWPRDARRPDVHICAGAALKWGGMCCCRL